MPSVCVCVRCNALTAYWHNRCTTDRLPACNTGNLRNVYVMVHNTHALHCTVQITTVRHSVLFTEEPRQQALAVALGPRLPGICSLQVRHNDSDIVCGVALDGDVHQRVCNSLR